MLSYGTNALILFLASISPYKSARRQKNKTAIWKDNGSHPGLGDKLMS